jgi:predicted transcriptional regulator
MLNRQRDEIVRDILTTAGRHPEGVGITTIMFRSYLSHNQAKGYLADLVEKGLLDNSNTGLGKNFYRTSPKGVEYLSALSSMTEMLVVETMRHAKNQDF